MHKKTFSNSKHLCILPIDKIVILQYTYNVIKRADTLKNGERVDTMTDKMTYGKALAYVLENCNVPADVKERLTALSASLAKKNSAERKPTKTQVENVSVKDAIAAFMQDGVVYTAAEIAKGVEISSAKASALLTQMRTDGRVVVTTEKRKNYYTLA